MICDNLVGCTQCLWSKLWGGGAIIGNERAGWDGHPDDGARSGGVILRTRCDRPGGELQK